MSDCVIPHILFFINHHGDIDPAIETVFQHAFHWANQMGLQGKKVSSLNLRRPKPSMRSEPSQLTCWIHCTKEEQKAWEEKNRENIKHNVLTGWIDDQED